MESLMLDPRIRQLAEVLIDHSCRLQSGEKLLIEAFDLPDPAIVCCLVELARERGEGHAPVEERVGPRGRCHDDES